MQTLAQLSSALRDPLSPLVIDLGGRFFCAGGVAVRPRQHVARTAHRCEDTVMDGNESPLGHPVNSDSRFAVGAGACTEEVSSSATSSASVHPADTMASRPTSALRQPLRRRSARRASARPVAAPQQHAAQADIEMLPDTEMRDVADIDARAAHAHAADALAAGLQRLGSDAAFSADTGDDVASGRGHEEGESDDSEAGDGPEWTGHRNALTPLNLAPSDPKKVCPPQFLDIIRPGTVLCNGVIELPECVSPACGCPKPLQPSV